MINLNQKCSDMLAVQRWLDLARLLVKNIYFVFNKALLLQTAFILMDYTHEHGALQANTFITGLLATLLQFLYFSDAGSHAIEYSNN